MDFLSRETRSHIMSCIRSKNNRTTERKFRAHLVQRGISGWQIQGETILGKPDFYFLESKTAIFIDSCFWHGCSIHARKPTSNVAYWRKKIRRNRQRDVHVTTKLRRQG